MYCWPPTRFEGWSFPRQVRRRQQALDAVSEVPPKPLPHAVSAVRRSTEGAVIKAPPTKEPTHASGADAAAGGVVTTEMDAMLASFEIVPKEAVSPRPCRYRDIRLRMPGLSTTLTTIHASPKARGPRLCPSSCRRLCALALRRRAPAVCPRPPYKCAHACLMRGCIDISRNHDKKCG